MLRLQWITPAVEATPFEWDGEGFAAVLGTTPDSCLTEFQMLLETTFLSLKSFHWMSLNSFKLLLAQSSPIQRETGYTRCAACPLQEVQLLLGNPLPQSEEVYEKQAAVEWGPVDCQREPVLHFCVGLQGVQGWSQCDKGHVGCNGRRFSGRVSWQIF